MQDKEYTYFANVEFSDHYANQLELTLMDPLSSILAVIYKHTYHQPYPARFPHVLEDTFHHSAEALFLEEPLKPQRKQHGALHATDTAVAAVVFFKLYEKYASEHTQETIRHIINAMPGETADEKRARLLQLLQIAAAFHDAGRLGRGHDHDEWKIRAANDCQLFIKKLLTNTMVEAALAERIADFFADTISTKDSKQTQNKSIIHSCLQSADSIESMRCNPQFHVNRLDIWMDAMGIRDQGKQNVIDPKKSAQLQKELFYFYYEWLEVLQLQEKLKQQPQLQIQTTYRSKASYLYLHPRKTTYKAPTSPRFDKKQQREMHSFETIVAELDAAELPMLSHYYFEKPQGEFLHLKALDAAITRDVGFRNRPERNAIDHVTLALIHLRYQLKNNLSQKVIQPQELDAIQNETATLIRALEQHMVDGANTGKLSPSLAAFEALEHYHLQLAPLLNRKGCALLKAAVVFLLTTAMLFFAISSLCALSVFALGGAAAISACLSTLLIPAIALTTAVSAVGGVLHAKTTFFNHPHQRLKQSVGNVEKQVLHASNNRPTSVLHDCKQYPFNPTAEYFESRFVPALTC